jgi:hypothetical protein
MQSRRVDVVRRIASAQCELRDIDRTIAHAKAIIERARPVTTEQYA